MPSLPAFLSKIQNKLGLLWWSTLKMFIASRIGDMMTLAIGLFIIPKAIDQSLLGAVQPVIKLAPLFCIPLSIILTGVLKYVTIYATNKEFGKIKQITQHLIYLSIIYTIIVVVAIWFWRDAFLGKLNINDPNVLWYVVALMVSSIWMPVAYTLAQSVKAFNAIIFTRVSGPAVRLVALLILISTYQISGIVAATIISYISMMLILFWASRRAIKGQHPPVCYKEDYKGMLQYSLWIAPFTALIATQFFMEPYAIRAILSTDDSAGFYMASTFGNIAMWVAPAMLPFLFPIVSEKHEKGESTNKIHLHALLLILAIGLSVAGVLFLLGKPILASNKIWRVHLDYWLYIPLTAVLATFTVAISAHIQHEHAVRRFRYLWYYAPITLGELFFLIYASFTLKGNWLTLPILMFLMIFARITFLLLAVFDFKIQRPDRDKRFSQLDKSIP